MKRLALIIAALVVIIGGAAAGAIAYLKPQFIFGKSDAGSGTGAAVDAAHNVPSYSEEASEENQARRYILRLVEHLGAVQDSIIRGDRAALADQQRLLNDIAREVQNFGQDQWSDYVNVRTSFLYVLSGGDAKVLKPLITQISLSASDDRLAKGIVSFAEGQAKKARELFEDIDPRSLDVSLVGPFALARASLYIDDDRTKAVGLLDDARLACPHTAIDEAAARREIPILFDLGDASRAMMLTTSYVREFGRSIYAWKLFRDIAQSVAKREELNIAETVDRFAEAFNDKDMQPAFQLFVDLAGEALLQGHLKLAGAAAKAAMKIEGVTPEDLEKARLYAAAADAPSGDAGNALKALDQIAMDRLSEEDTEIREVAGFIADTVVGARMTAQTDASASGKARHQAAGKPRASETAKAETALNSADTILKEADSMISGSVK
jgi:chemotaxis protein MotC